MAPGARRVFLPDDWRLSARENREPGKQAAKHPVADDENALDRRRAGERVQSGRRQRQQHGFSPSDP